MFPIECDVVDEFNRMDFATYMDVRLCEKDLDVFLQ